MRLMINEYVIVESIVGWCVSERVNSCAPMFNVDHGFDMMLVRTESRFVSNC